MAEQARVGARFELIARVGAGSFGEVWRAKDDCSGRDVAVKRLHGHLDEPSSVARFLREATALSRVRNENVVEYVAHGTDEGGKPWVATEWLDGTDFGRLRSMPRVTRRRMLEVLREVAQGAGALHRAGLVHRDLKPTNVFVPLDGGPTRVVDLGVAHVVDGSMLTESGAILGTPAYMSPEQVRGDRVDPRADLWSIGVMIFEFVAGETPFASPHAVAVLGRVLLDPAPPLASVDPGAPSRLDTLVASLLDKDPSRRPSSATYIVEEITRILEDPAYVEWLDSAPRYNPGLDETVASGSANTNTRGERRWVAMIAAQMAEPERDDWARRCEGVGARVEVVRGAVLAGFGMQHARGDELNLAARFALASREQGGAVALVAGWAELRGGSVSAGALIDRVATLLDRAKSHEVLAWLDGAERLDDRFDLESVDAHTVRIVSARSQAIGEGASEREHKVLGQSVAMVGRDKELALLHALVAESIVEQSARCALVVGDAGIGKSRLLAELRARARTLEAPPFWLVLRGDPMSSDVPLAMLTDALRDLARVTDEKNAEAQTLSWAEQWLGRPLSASLRDGMLSLFGVSDTTFERPALHSADAHHERSERDMEALSAIVAAALARRPLVLAVEDLHWADRATVDALALLFGRFSEQPLTLLAVARPEVSVRYPTLWRSVARTELRLPPLSDRASEALISSVMALDPEQRRSLVRRAGGNPLFLEELVRARAGGLVALPAAVHTVLQARLDALGPEVRRVAQTASVFGPTFWSEGVAALRGSRSVGSALIALERAELVTMRSSSRVAHCTEYTFSHALARDAAYQMLVENERELLHARAAEWLVSVGERDPALLAQHLSAAARPLDAAEQFRRAAQKALSESAFRDAVEHCSRALQLQPKGDGAIEALLLRATARDALGETEAMLADAETARDSNGSDPTFAIRAQAVCAEALFALGRLNDADEALRAVLEESHASFVAARVQALVRLAEVDIANGRGSEAVALIDEAVSWLDDAGAGYELLRVRARRVRAMARLAAGDAPASLRESRRALADAEVLGNRAAIVEVRATYALLLLRGGFIDEARRECQRAQADAELVRAAALRMFVSLVFCEVVAETAPLHEAVQHCAQTSSEANAAGRRRFAQWCDARRATLQALEGGPVAPSLDAGDGVGGVVAMISAAMASEWLRVGELELAAETISRAVGALGPRAESLQGESFVRWVQARVLLAQGRERDADVLLSSVRERLERKAARFGNGPERAQYLRGTKARRALVALIERRLGLAAK
ncbi:MAG: protein kinase [Polyangiales bacterium]